MTDERESPDDDGRDRRGWHFRKELSSGDVLLAASFAVGMFLWGSKIDSRLAVVEANQAMQAQIDARQDVAARDNYRDIKADLGEIRRLLVDKASK